MKTQDGTYITCRVHRSQWHATGALAVVFHGGGWCIGDLDMEEQLCSRLANDLGMVVVNVGYRLAPEYPFPTAVYDCYDAFRWAVDSASEIGADLFSGVIIGGVSAGGNLASVVAHMCNDLGFTPALSGCLLVIPALCYHAAMPPGLKPRNIAWEENRDAPILSTAACEFFIRNYVPDKEQRKSPFFSPLLWPTGHVGLPPHVIQVCGLDPLRDEGLLFEDEVRGAGVATKLYTYPGMPHGFWTIFPEIEASKRVFDDAVSGTRWLLQQHAQRAQS